RGVSRGRWLDVTHRALARGLPRGHGDSWTLEYQQRIADQIMRVPVPDDFGDTHQFQMPCQDPSTVSNQLGGMSLVLNIGHIPHHVASWCNQPGALCGHAA